ILSTPHSSLFPYTTLFRSKAVALGKSQIRDVVDRDNRRKIRRQAQWKREVWVVKEVQTLRANRPRQRPLLLRDAAAIAVKLDKGDRKSTRLNSSHDQISYA